MRRGVVGLGFALALVPQSPVAAAASAGSMAVSISDNKARRVKASAVIEIDAPPVAVWNAILDFDARRDENWLVEKVKVYANRKTARRIERRARWDLSVLGTDIVYHTVYFWRPDGWVLRWTLDEDKENDLAFAEGKYVLRPADGNPQRTQLTYVFEVESKRRAPLWIRRKLTGRGVRTLLKRVKARSEAASSSD